MEQEAWLSGNLEEVAPILMPAAHALKQSARDIEKAAKNLTVEEVGFEPHGAPSAAFHLRHIAGSIDRLLTYARGEKLSKRQFDELAAELSSDEIFEVEIIVHSAVERIETAVEHLRRVDLESLFESRTVGRKKLSTNVFGLLFHTAEHTQRHTGQFITTTRIVRLTLRKNG